MKIEGTVAIVTGGAQGIGKAICEALLENGGKVCMLDLNKEKGVQLAKDFEEKYGKGRAMFISCNVTSKAQMEVAFQQTKDAFGRLDIVVNNAGIAQHNDLSDDVWQKMVDINLNAVIQGTVMGLKHMGTLSGKGHGGTIINVASMAGLLADVHQPVYTATKHGVVGFSRSLQLMKDQEGVRVNCICPTYSNTDLLWRSLNNAKTPQEKRMAEFVKASGIVRPEFVASGVLKLIEDETKNAAVMRVTSQKGIDYKIYRDLMPRL